MARVNVTMPDDLCAQARQQGLNISRLAQHAVAAELTRRSKIAQLDAYLAQLESPKRQKPANPRYHFRQYFGHFSKLDVYVP